MIAKHVKVPELTEEFSKEYEKVFAVLSPKLSKTISKNVQELRKMHFKHIHGAAKQLYVLSVVSGVSVPTLRRIEEDAWSANSRLENFARIAAFYNVPLGTLFMEDPYKYCKRRAHAEPLRVKTDVKLALSRTIVRDIIFLIEDNSYGVMITPDGQEREILPNQGYKLFNSDFNFIVGLFPDTESGTVYYGYSGSPDLLYTKLRIRKSKINSSDRIYEKSNTAHLIHLQILAGKKVSIEKVFGLEATI